jgi:hypothetical protein
MGIVDGIVGQIVDARIVHDLTASPKSHPQMTQICADSAVDRSF